MKRSNQVSESLELGVLLALSGGFMDAYSYIERGEVFANAQTGNMILMGLYFWEGNYSESLNYIVPVICFVIGIALADIVRIRGAKRFHWRQISVLVEAIILMCVAFIPHSMDLLANSMTSLACGIQVESFRKIHGNGIATTMCIGNLRSGTENLCHFLRNRDKGCIEKTFIYYGIIFFFILGAIIGNFFVKIFHQKSIIICSILLFISFIFMFIDRECREYKEKRNNK